jgi:hypothetical protein
MIKTNGFIFAVTTALLINSAYAETVENEKQGWLGKVGTLGVGIDLTYSVNEKINARFNINKGKIDFDFEENGVDYNGNFNASTVGGLIDYYPHTNDFRLTTGFYINQNELNLAATGGANSTIGDDNVSLNGLQLNLDVGFKKVVPYLGLGWGNMTKEDNDWQFGVDAGVLFQGSAESNLELIGSAYDGLDAELKLDLQEALVQEKENINDELKDFKLYPVISVGAGYRF